MPELPEVETVRRGLAPLIEGRKIKAFTLHRPDLRSIIPVDLPKKVKGKTIEKTSRHGKTMVWHIKDGPDIAWHLGMSGSFSAGKRKKKPGKHDHVEIVLDDGVQILFNDPRRFGNLTYASKAMTGIDPLTALFTPQALAAIMKNRAAPVKNLLLDQRLIAGIGNIYASEALFLARLHPETPSKEITDPKIKALRDAVQKVLKQAIASGGSSLRNHVGVDGKTGQFQHRFAVYGRAAKPCLVCKTSIKRCLMAGRSTFFCPCCQALKTAPKRASKNPS